MIIENPLNRKIRALDNAEDILFRVQALTGLAGDVSNLRIVVVNKPQELSVLFNKMYPSARINPPSFYDMELDTIFVSFDLTSHMLAHELTHALIDRFVGKKLPNQLIEILPQWVDENIKLGFSWPWQN